jgi:hypothetical protein
MWLPSALKATARVLPEEPISYLFVTSHAGLTVNFGILVATLLGRLHPTN